MSDDNHKPLTSIEDVEEQTQIRPLKLRCGEEEIECNLNQNLNSNGRSYLNDGRPENSSLLSLPSRLVVLIVIFIEVLFFGIGLIICNNYTSFLEWLIMEGLIGYAIMVVFILSIECIWLGRNLEAVSKPAPLLFFPWKVMIYLLIFILGLIKKITILCCSKIQNPCSTNNGFFYLKLEANQNILIDKIKSYASIRSYIKPTLYESILCMFEMAPTKHKFYATLVFLHALGFTTRIITSTNYKQRDQRTNSTKLSVVIVSDTPDQLDSNNNSSVSSSNEDDSDDHPGQDNDKLKESRNAVYMENQTNFVVLLLALVIGWISIPFVYYIDKIIQSILLMSLC